MLPFDLATTLGASPRILLLGAHPDDVEIGCGGLIRRLARTLPGATWHWAVLTGNAERHDEARASAARFLGAEAKVDLVLERFRDGYLPYEGAAVKDAFESLKRAPSPDLILTHCEHDRHQDHRLISELTRNTWRNHLILEYEIPKFDGDLATPQSYFPLTRADAEEKAAAILECFPSQAKREWFDREVLLGLMRLRGVECNAPDRYAEAFYARKWTIGLGVGS